MIQTIIAVVIILWFLGKLLWQKKNQKINKSEFIFWLCFWFLTLILIFSLKQLDKLVAGLGFSSSGIQVLLYLAVAVLTYFIFRIRMRLSVAEKNIVKLSEQLALNKKN